MKVISHDAFARVELVREVSDHVHDCVNCGQLRSPRGKALALYRYGTRRDNQDAHRINWHRGYFCGKSCYDSYHGRR